MIPSISDVDVNVLAALTAAGGAILIKIIEKSIGRRSENALEAERIREELRREISRFRDETVRLQNEVSEWRQKYWNIKGEHDSASNIIEKLEAERDIRIERIKNLEYKLKEDRQDIEDLGEEVEDLKQTFKKFSPED